MDKGTCIALGVDQWASLGLRALKDSETDCSIFGLDLLLATMLGDTRWEKPYFSEMQILLPVRHIRRHMNGTHFPLQLRILIFQILQPSSLTIKMIHPLILSLTPFISISQRTDHQSLQSSRLSSSVGDVLHLLKFELIAVFVDSLTGGEKRLSAGVVE